MNALTELSALRIQAGRLKKQFERRHQDRAFEAEGGVVLYALDNDVITNITAPWKIQFNPRLFYELARRHLRRLHYLQYLMLDDLAALESINYIIAEYFLRRHPSRPVPFLLIHPGNVELQATWNQVYERAKRDSASLENDYRQAIEVLKENRIMTVIEKGALEKIVRRLLTCLHRRDGAIAELQRIVMLQDGCNILPLDRVVVDDAALTPSPDAEGRRQIADLKKSWLRELKLQRKSTPRTGAEDADRWPTNNDIDAEVLGKLEWINQQFVRDAAAGGPKRRLCYVTGDRTIESIAVSRTLGTMKFDEACLRNPACFLSDCEFFELAGVKTPDFLARFPAPPPSATADVAETNDPELRTQGRSLGDWISVLFPEQPESRGPAEVSPDAHEKAHKKIALTAQQARLDWAEYVRFAAADTNLRHDDFEELVHEITGGFERGANELYARLQSLRDRARSVSDEAMTRFGVAGLLAGFWSIDRTVDRWPSRLIPVIRFDSFPQARALVDRLRGTAKLADAQLELQQDKIMNLLKEDPTGYTRFVVFAMAFALAGQWPSALTVATAAFSVASTLNREQWPDSPVRGDEAAYLCAVFRRLCAKRSEDLDESDRWLAIARERQLSKPWRTRIAALPDPESYRDPRFIAEELAIWISRLQFAEFMSDPHSTELVGLREQLLAYRSIRNFCEQHLQVLATLNEERVEVLDAVTQRLATGFLQLQLLAKLKAEGESEMREDAVRMIRLLRQYDVAHWQPASKDEARHSQMPMIVRLVYLCSSALFLPAEAGDSLTREQLLKDIKATAKRVEETVVMPYDPTRAQRLVALVESNFAVDG